MIPMFFPVFCFLFLLTKGPTPGKICNTNTSTHTASLLTYLKKDPVSTTDN